MPKLQKLKENKKKIEIELTDLKALAMSEQTKLKIVITSIKSKLHQMEIKLK